LAAAPFEIQGKLQAAFPLQRERFGSGGLRIPAYSRAAATAGS